eukprot:3934269-Rhodomonas_salina.7
MLVPDVAERTRCRIGGVLRAAGTSTSKVPNGAAQRRVSVRVSKCGWASMQASHTTELGTQHVASVPCIPQQCRVSERSLRDCALSAHVGGCRSLSLLTPGTKHAQDQ